MKTILNLLSGALDYLLKYWALIVATIFGYNSYVYKQEEHYSLYFIYLGLASLWVMVYYLNSIYTKIEKNKEQ